MKNKFLFLIFWVTLTYAGQAQEEVRQVEFSNSFTATILPKKGCNSRAIRHKEGVKVITSFYLPDTTIIRQSLTNRDGSFEVMIPDACKGIVPISFNTYDKAGKQLGYLVEIDRNDGRKAEDMDDDHPYCLVDSLGYTIYVYDMLRESELQLLRGKKLQLLPQWLVKRKPIEVAYKKEHRALAWSDTQFSLFKSPIFHLSYYYKDGERSILHYTYNLFRAPDESHSLHNTDYNDVAHAYHIPRLGGEEILMNRVSVVAVSMAPYDIQQARSTINTAEANLQVQKNLEPYNPMKVGYYNILPLVYVDKDTFFTYITVK